MDEPTLRARVEAWRARADAAGTARERQACAELARHYEALLEALRRTAAQPGRP